jgi:hypothetical protein
MFGTRSFMDLGKFSFLLSVRKPERGSHVEQRSWFYHPILQGNPQAFRNLLASSRELYG